MICSFCNIRQATQRHHKFSQTKNNRKIYGKILDMDFNIEYVCIDCHAGHAKIPDWALWDEKKFRSEAEALGIALPDGSKSFRNKRLNYEM